MTKTLQLRNLFATYEKGNKGSKNEVYYNSHMNNYIVFTPDDNCDTDSICNSISPEAYNYLMDVLNTSKNVVVLWSQVEGVTSDYTIFIDTAQDIRKPTYKNIMDKLTQRVAGSNGTKYNIVKDGRLTPIQREEMIAKKSMITH